MLYLRWPAPPFILWQIKVFCLLFRQHEAPPASVLYEKGITISDASKIIDVIEKKCPHVTWNVFTAEDWIVKDRTDPHVIHEETVVETISMEGSLHSLSDTVMIDKILCMCDPEYMSSSETLLRKYFPKLSIARSSDSLLEKFLFPVLLHSEIIIMIWKCWRQ